MCGEGGAWQSFIHAVLFLLAQCLVRGRDGLAVLHKGDRVFAYAVFKMGGLAVLHACYDVFAPTIFGRCLDGFAYMPPCFCAHNILGDGGGVGG